MIRQRLTLSALSAMLMCNMAYAQIYEHQILIDTTLAAKKPITRKITNIDYGTRTQRHTGIPTVFVDILDGQKTNGVLESIGQDYKYVDGQWKPNGNRYNIYMSWGTTREIGNSDIIRDKNWTLYAREDRWNNYYKPVRWGSIRDKNYDLARIQVIDASKGMKERDELVKLRGRGNSTWRTTKRGYRLKFPHKTALLSLGDGTNTHADAKSWTLIANAFDKSMIRNAIASEIGKKVGLPFNVSYKLVDIYFNNEYYGCYQVADQIAIGGRRIDINEEEGWLLEAVASREEFASAPYISPNIQGIDQSQQEWDVINVKNPEVENDNPNDPKITAITNWFNQVNFADHSEETGFRKYIDIYSFADYLIVLDISGNYDGTIQNYMYRDKGTNAKLKFGPIWDNDLAFGNFWGDTTYKLQREGIKEDKKTRFSSMIDAAMKDAVFMKALMRKWNKVYPTMPSFIASKVSEIADANIAAINDNNTVWPISEDQSGWVGGQAPDYETAIYRINNYISNHLPFVNTSYTNCYNAFKTDNTILINAGETNNSSTPFSSVSNKICTTYVQNKSFAANTWATICLPFNLDEDELKNYFGDDVQLAEYTRLDGAGTLMVFSKQANLLLEAGVPYLIKPSKAVNKPTFTEVVLSIQTPKTIKISSSDAVGFTGTFFKTNIPTTNVSTLQGIDFKKYTGGTIDGISAYVNGSSIVSLQIEGEDLTPVIALGDVNEDGNVSVLDLTTMINYILGSTPSSFNREAADMNGDNDVTILDVTMLINLLLSQSAE